MLYSCSANLAYLHIHKTGGISLRNSFRSAFPDAVDVGNWWHYSLEEYRPLLSKIGVEADSVRIVATVRDPYSHVVSIYSFWRSSGADWVFQSTAEDGRRELVEAARTKSFSDFVRYYVTCKHPDCRVFDELLFVGGCLPANVCVIRIERAAEELDFYLNRVLKLGVAVDLPFRNTSEHGEVGGHYDAMTRQLVHDRYEWAFREGLYPLRSAAQETVVEALRAAGNAREKAGAALQEAASARQEVASARQEAARAFEERALAWHETIASREEMAAARREADWLRFQLNTVRASKSFRSGRGLTWPLRMMRTHLSRLSQRP